MLYNKNYSKTIIKRIRNILFQLNRHKIYVYYNIFESESYLTGIYKCIAIHIQIFSVIFNVLYTDFANSSSPLLSSENLVNT